MNRLEKKRTGSQRKDFYLMVTVLVMAGTYVYRFFLWHLIGDKGIACHAAANEIYMVFGGMISYGLSEAAATVVKYRIKREQFKNAQRVLGSALILGTVLGVALSCLFGFFGYFIAIQILHLQLAGLAVSLMAPALLFMMLTGVFRGYFQGNGSRIPSMHSQILHLIVMAAGGLLGAAALKGYGERVSALLQNEDYISAYGAMGASIGFLAASTLCFLHTLILYFIYRRSLSSQINREVQKNPDTRLHIFHMLVSTGIIYCLFWLGYNGLPLADQCLFFLFRGQNGQALPQWGAYYGKCLVLTGVIGAVIALICILPVRRIVSYAERDELRIARERLRILIHQCALISVPAAIFLAVLAENILELLFGGNQQQAAGWVQIGSAGIVLGVFSAVFTEFIIKSRKLKIAALVGAGAFVLHMVLLWILLKISKLDIPAVLLATLFFYCLIDLGGFFFVRRNLQYTQEWIRSIAVTVIDGAIAGVIAMLLNKVFEPILGALISTLIALAVAIIVYMVLLLVTRAFQEGELESMPGGRIMITLAGLLHIS